MVITKELEWIRPYVASVEYLLPRLAQVRKISGKKAHSERGQHCVGLMVYYNKKSIRICIYISYKDRNTSKVGRYTTLDILATLAHELAHLIHWTHTPDHKQLECKIHSIFMTRLRKDGYISEEEEVKNGMFYKRE